ncbi:sensor histidine kinase [Paraflavitalea speifideaquila]|uniref:sensor histidine kinase n=1 Tax=Paraflavitalea speifideaquila TaxID=3076558 RepID=UPI0028E890FD|nr:histidine kinase [Paraflavitalea speifideiaquila]
MKAVLFPDGPIALTLYSSTDRRLRLLGPLILFMVGALFFRLQLYLDTPRAKLPILVCVALGSGYIGWELARLTALFLQHKLPGLERIRQRLIFLILAIIVLSHMGYILRNFIHSILGSFPWRWPHLIDYTSSLGVLIFYATVTLNIYEGGYLWKQWRQTFAEKEALIRSEWQAKFDLLKNQINPHFLFNSLNALSSLISEDPKQAEQFTDELSKVYRYLLQSNNQEMVTLAVELQFILSYGHLLKTRHGDGFRLSIDVDKQYHSCLIPSLTLQLLVENAVKHNIVSRKQPLEVMIGYRPPALLVVENRIQKKENQVMSNGVGLSNINNKFRLLNLPEISIEVTPERFVVLVPLGT